MKAEYDRVTAQFNAESAILMAGGELGGVNPVYSAKEESE